MYTAENRDLTKWIHEVSLLYCSCEVRDRDETGWKKLHAHCLSTLRDAARCRRDCAFKLHFFDKLLQNSAQQQKQSNTGKSSGATPVLLTGLRIVTLFMVSSFDPCIWRSFMAIIESYPRAGISTIELSRMLPSANSSDDRTKHLW